MPQKIEKEAKFLVRELEKIETRLQAMGAVCTQPSILETNLCFDTAQKTMWDRVLRLRQDTRTRLTYKGTANAFSQVKSRIEYEIDISDFDTGRKILEAIGLQVVSIYEKYRAAYQIGETEISLDRMPFGNFVEIESTDESTIHMIATKLGLTWENRSSLTYMRLFDILRESLGLTMRDLTFENFEQLTVLPEHLQLLYSN